MAFDFQFIRFEVLTLLGEQGAGVGYRLVFHLLEEGKKGKTHVVLMGSEPGLERGTLFHNGAAV